MRQGFWSTIGIVLEVYWLRDVATRFGVHFSFAVMVNEGYLSPPYIRRGRLWRGLIVEVISDIEN